MPLNTLRLNHQASSHPNERIVFIKPLPRTPSQKDDYDRAELVLKAIAAQCLPIMKDNYLSVTTLEEYEPNPEFIGRNFNNGEIIQLVIRSKSGTWLPLNMIQMVMMHELAHNTHMNHGKGFWQARNLYAGEMRLLWSRGYTGQGLWGQGRMLSTLEHTMGSNLVQSGELADLPLCGGTFRSRRKKRKAKGQDLTWKEKRDKRIEKKFGKNGTALGEDEDRRLTLEINRKNGSGSLGSKPRVAQSKRGRELRAAAALARFGTNKKEVEELEAHGTNEGEDEETETESEEEYEELDAGQEDAKDIDGRKFLDKKGQGMIRVCEEEDGDDVQVKNEMVELANLETIPTSQPEPLGQQKTAKVKTATPPSSLPAESPAAAPSQTKTSKGKPACAIKPPVPFCARPSTDTPGQSRSRTVSPERPAIQQDTANDAKNLEINCPICSMTNEAMRSTCVACAHVLDVRKDSRHWQCRSDTCRDSHYINAGDCGICGICGARMPRTQLQDTGPRLTEIQSSHIAYL